MWQLLSEVCRANVKVLMENCKCFTFVHKIIHKEYWNQCTKWINEWKLFLSMHKIICNVNEIQPCFNHNVLSQDIFQHRNALIQNLRCACTSNLQSLMTHDCNFQFIKNGSILTKAYWIVSIVTRCDIAYWLLINDFSIEQRACKRACLLCPNASDVILQFLLMWKSRTIVGFETWLMPMRSLCKTIVCGSQKICIFNVCHKLTNSANYCGGIRVKWVCVFLYRTYL